jgi:hypothetical protein
MPMHPPIVIYAFMCACVCVLCVCVCASVCAFMCACVCVCVTHAPKSIQTNYLRMYPVMPCVTFRWPKKRHNSRRSTNIHDSIRYEHTIAGISYEHQVLRRAAAPLPPPAPAAAAAATTPAPTALTLLEVVEQRAELESSLQSQRVASPSSA